MGTEVVLQGVSDEDIERAKAFFLRYSDEKLLEDTKVFAKASAASRPCRVSGNRLVTLDGRPFGVRSPLRPVTR